MLTGIFSFIFLPDCSSAEVDKDEIQELLETHEQRTSLGGLHLVKHEDFWFVVTLFRPILSAQKYFKAKDSDIILATNPKSGTTWLKALTFSIINRNIYTIDRSPLLASHAHTVVPALEFDLYLHQENPNLEHLPNPRIISTHIPFKLLSDSIRESKCKIIYICRNPLDQFISLYHFLLENNIERDGVRPFELDEAFDMFCQGIQAYGPFWEHILGYWNAHLENHQKVLFLKYEDLREDIRFHVKKIAEFVGFPFSVEEEKEAGVVEEISKLCSFKNLKNLEVNKSGCTNGGLKNSSFFRKGEVGDWMNYLSPAMGERMEKVMESKFNGSGLMWN